MSYYRIAINSMALDGKLPQGDPRWQAFNDSFVNSDLTAREIADAIHIGHSYAAWHEGRRKTENFILSQHIAIDMDTGDERSSIKKLQEHELVRMYGGLIHSTASHSIAHPRSRVIFFLDQPMDDSTKYSAAAAFLITQFPGADTACKDASRFFYGAAGCTIALIDRVLPVAQLRRLHKLSAKTSTKPSTKPSPVEQQPADLEDVSAALAKVGAYDIDYNRWIGILAALKREFGDKALPVAVAWAQGKAGEVEHEWERLRLDRPNGMSVGSIFYLANGG